MTAPRLAFLASHTEAAQQALAELSQRYGQHAPDQADILVPLGGDGFMLQTLHRHGLLGKPVFGMKLGTVGFLMNHHRDDDLPGPAARAVRAAVALVRLRPRPPAGSAPG